MPWAGALALLLLLGTSSVQGQAMAVGASSATQPPASELPASELPSSESPTQRLVFGSFAQSANAHRYAALVSQRIAIPIEVTSIETGAARAYQPARYRVVGPLGSQARVAELSNEAREAGLPAWRLLGVAPPKVARSAAVARAPVALAVATSIPSVASVPAAAAVGVVISTKPSTSEERLEERLEVSRRGAPAAQFDVDLGVQNRLFFQTGSSTDDQAQQSASAELSWSRELSGGSNLLAATLFGRVDSDDSHRTHADVRELTFTHSADSWQLQAGIGQVFWGVVEFNHLIDIVNQTDLVENLDAEEKLGQPMVAFTALRDWGTLEVFVLPGFRERTLPGLDGRLTTSLPIDRSAAEFESGAETQRIDGLVRLSTQLGGVLFDVYHFNGTRRTPRFEVRTRGAGSVAIDLTEIDSSELFLVPIYDTVRQTAIAAQANAGDTAFKLEALQQDGGPDSYWAGAIGVEHTFVGAFGRSTDLGVVLEYHYDSRAEDAFDSFFEHDLALGLRLAANDLHDSQALFGVVWDTTTNEAVVQLEASRRLSDRWSIELESRFFGGGTAVGGDASLAEIFNTNNKLGSVQRDDYLQIEFIRFF